MNVSQILQIFSLLLLFSCQSRLTSPMTDDGDATTLTRSYPLVDQRLWPYFSNFENEALLRNISVDLNAAGIRGHIESIEQDRVAGVCSYGNRQRLKDITIDEEFWSRANYLYKEYIVFHELGHCYLFRGHKEACFTNGTYVSMMRSGNGTCRDNYSQSSRDYYLNELFGVVTD